jgi:hypothetical protein
VRDVPEPRHDCPIIRHAHEPPVQSIWPQQSALREQLCVRSRQQIWLLGLARHESPEQQLAAEEHEVPTESQVPERRLHVKMNGRVPPSHTRPSWHRAPASQQN